MAEIYRALIADQERLNQITTDVLTAHNDGANILVLTTWIDHLNAITDDSATPDASVTVLQRPNEGARAPRDHRAPRQPYGRTNPHC